MLFYVQQSSIPFGSLLYYDPQLYKRIGFLLHLLCFLLFCHACLSLAFLLTPEPFSTLINLITILLGIIAVKSCVRFTLLVYSVSSLIVTIHMIVRFSNRIEKPNFGYAADMKIATFATVLNTLVANRNASILPFIVMDSFPQENESASLNVSRRASLSSLIDEKNGQDAEMLYTYYSFLLRVPQLNNSNNSSKILSGKGNTNKTTTPDTLSSINSIEKNTSKRNPYEAAINLLHNNNNTYPDFLINWQDLYRYIQSAPSPWRISLEKLCLCSTSIVCVAASLVALALQWWIKRHFSPVMQTENIPGLNQRNDLSNPRHPHNNETVMVFGYPNGPLPATNPSPPVDEHVHEEYPVNSNINTRNNFVPFSGEGVSLSNLAVSRATPTP